MVIDDFLPNDILNSVYDFVCMRDYKYINTRGAVARVWRMHDGFPLRSVDSYFKSYEGKPANNAGNFRWPI